MIVFHFDLQPEDADFEEVLEDIGGTIKDLRERMLMLTNGLMTPSWKDWRLDPEEGVAKTYASIIRRGLSAISRNIQRQGHEAEEWVGAGEDQWVEAAGYAGMCEAD